MSKHYFHSVTNIVENKDQLPKGKSRSGTFTRTFEISTTEGSVTIVLFAEKLEYLTSNRIDKDLIKNQNRRNDDRK